MRKRYYILGGIGAVILVAQVVPVEKTNPDVIPSRTVEARLEVPPAIRRILDRSCYDCHSPRTVWPWYSHVAPVSWLLASDVSEGRGKVNFSEWAQYSPQQAEKKLVEICKAVKEGDMPPWYYTPMHAGSKLTEADRQTLCQWTESVKDQ